MKQVKTIKELDDIIEQHLRSGYCKNPFIECELKPETMDEIEDLVYINRYGFWTYDSQPTMQYLKYQDPETNKKCSWFKRGYIMGIIEKKYAYELAYNISSLGKYVFTYNPNGTNHFFKNGIKKTLTEENTEDIIVTYCVTHKKNGDPELTNYSHIWNFGSDVDRVEGYFENKDIENYILDNHIEICIIEPDFYSKESLIVTTALVIEDMFLMKKLV